MPRGVATDNIFISYRREDSAAYAGRLCDLLSSEFGEQRVFMDVEDIAPGQDFAATIDSTLAQCSSLLVVIGPRWIEILKRRASESKNDYVAHEIEAALNRKATVIPVLVGGARMVDLSALPEKLAGLHFHQAVELRDATFREDCARLAVALGAKPGERFEALEHAAPGRKRWWWIAAGCAALALGIGWSIGPWTAYRERNVQVNQYLNTARTQSKLAEYEPAFNSYQSALKLAPANRAALDGQVDAAMLWLQNFHVAAAENQNVEDLAAPPLAQIMNILYAGLARTNGTEKRAADILAHLGWAHWLNQRIAAKEFGTAAEDALGQALRLDPSNVYANAMLGGWLLQSNGNTEQALRCFATAVNSGRERPLVRSLQIGGLFSSRAAGTQAELIKAVNQMRINSEPLAEGTKERILSRYNAPSPAASSQEEFRETISAVPADEAWATFLWLAEKPAGDAERENQNIHHAFVHASILEQSGKSAEARSEFQQLERELKQRRYSGTLSDDVTEAVKRLGR